MDVISAPVVDARRQTLVRWEAGSSLAATVAVQQKSKAKEELPSGAEKQKIRIRRGWLVRNDKNKIKSISNRHSTRP